MTLLTTISEYHGMIPGKLVHAFIKSANSYSVGVILSRHADARSYRLFLEQMVSAILIRAGQLVKDPSVSTYSGNYTESMMGNAEAVLEDGCSPLLVMIDGADEEETAIEEALLGTHIRVCQFHLMHACAFKVRLAYGSTPAGPLKGQQALQEIRQVQRCEIAEQFPQFRQTLSDSIDEIDGHQHHTRDILIPYLDHEWFSTRWRRYTCDYGIPRGVTRDGSAATNHYIEAAFKTFHKIFLALSDLKQMTALLQFHIIYHGRSVGEL
jgi:hypothetical protein